MDRIAAETLLMHCIELFRLEGDEGWYSYLFKPGPPDESLLQGLPKGEIKIVGLSGDYGDRDAATIHGLLMDGMLRHVESLRMRGSGLTDEGLKLFAALDSLRVLDIWDGCEHITDSGVQVLASLHRLECLRLFIDNLTDEAVPVVLSMTSLVDLDLNFSKVTDKAIETIERCSQLRHLSLSNTAITDRGLVRLKALQLLENLHIQDTKVTEAGVRDLRQALPYCKVEWP